ncbi:MAG: aminotransferase class I/II-fold pyridoxal phosphate-dependent enzyme [Ruminococcus sp.]|jgi:histidinol-phosphate aminotransferase|nr:aminotransferase class I/II-fold pyridoxal phosphate-dependent enzyme [Ruminococcus sp.]
MYYVNENIKELHRVKFHDERSGVLRLDMNENPEGLPKEVFDAVMSKITPEYIATYPEKDRLMMLLAEHDRIAYETISVTAGSDEAMRLIFHCFGQPGKKLLTVTPTFEMYGVYAKMFGMKHEMVGYKEDFSIDPGEILQAIDADTGIVILLNPNSPIGYTFHENHVREIIERAQKAGAIVVIDEAYHYFYTPTFMPLIKEYDNLFVLRTFSKLFSMAGLRIGYVSGNKELIGYIEKAESTFNVNNIAILFALEVIQNQNLTDRLVEAEREGRIWIAEKLKNAGYQTLVMEGNFVLFLPKKDSRLVVEELKKKNVWVRDYSKGILKGWIRVSTGSLSCMEKFWKAFNEK